MQSISSSWACICNTEGCYALYICIYLIHFVDCSLPLMQCTVSLDNMSPGSAYSDSVGSYCLLLLPSFWVEFLITGILVQLCYFFRVLFPHSTWGRGVRKQLCGPSCWLGLKMTKSSKGWEPQWLSKLRKRAGSITALYLIWFYI